VRFLLFTRLSAAALGGVLVLAATVPAALAADYLRDDTGVAGLKLGACAAFVGDHDGDGADELLVGAPGFQAQGQDAGRAYLWIGGTQLTLEAESVWTGQGGERFGQAVARLGDVNGDGWPDFAVGAPYADNAGSEAGRVYVYFGGLPLPTSADLVLEGPNPGGRFGWAIAPLGDFDGDGRDDFAVGAPYTDAAGIEAGAVFVYFGASGGPPATPDLTLLGQRAYEHLGWSLAGAGEFLGGNANCLAAGAPSHETPSTAIQGRVYVWQGTTLPNPGPDTTADLVLQSSATAVADNEFGYSIANVGSFDGDGDPDLAVGIPWYAGGGLQRGRVEIFLGGFDADEDTDRTCDGPAAGSRFGWSVASAGDVTGSAVPDVLVGAPFDDVLGADAGRAFLWPGGSGSYGDADSLPLADRGDVPAPGTLPGDQFGYWCAGDGDLDADGEADHVICAPFGNVTSFATAGWVRVNDTSGAAVPVALSGWQCDWTATGGVLASAAVGAPADAVARVTVTRRDLGSGQAVVVFAGAPAAASVADLAGRAGPQVSGQAAVGLLAGQLTLLDPDAALQTSGAVSYTLDLAGPDQVLLASASFAGPAGPAPDSRALATLAPAMPNPCNPRTVLRFRAQAGVSAVLQIIDLRGRLIRTLHAGPATGAWQQAAWDGQDASGRPAPSGAYLVRLDAGGELRQGRVMLAR